MFRQTASSFVRRETSGRAFRALHQRDDAFLIPIRGMPVLRDSWRTWASKPWLQQAPEMMAHVAAIAATDLPVSADLENGFGDSAETVAETTPRAPTKHSPG